MKLSPPFDLWFFDFFCSPASISLAWGLARRKPREPSRAFLPLSVKFHGPGPLPEHPSGQCLTGTTTRIQGLGRSPPRLRLGITCEWAHNRKEQYRDNKKQYDD